MKYFGKLYVIERAPGHVKARWPIVLVILGAGLIAASLLWGIL